MDEFNKLSRAMTLEFFGTGFHKITPEKLFQTDDAVFLVCSVQRRKRINFFAVTSSGYLYTNSRR